MCVPCSSGCCHTNSQIFKHNGRNTIYWWPSHPQLTFPLRKYCFLHFLSKKTIVYKFPSPSLLREEPQLRRLEDACPGKGPKLPARFWSWQYWLVSADYEISRTSVGWFLNLTSDNDYDGCIYTMEIGELNQKFFLVFAFTFF